MMPFFPILLAAGNADLIEIAVIVIIVFLSAIGQLLAKLRPPQPPAGQPRPVPPQMADEIGEFLRRAAERRGAQGPRPVAPPQPAPKATPQPPAEQPVPAKWLARPR